MRLIDKEHKHPPFDCASGMAAALLATGAVEVYKDPTPSVKHITNFAVREGDRVEDTILPPFIAWHCSVCGPGRISGKEAHKGKVNHVPPNGFVQEIPADVQRDFVALRKRWERR